MKPPTRAPLGRQGALGLEFSHLIVGWLAHLRACPPACPRRKLDCRRDSSVSAGCVIPLIPAGLWPPPTPCQAHRKFGHALYPAVPGPPGPHRVSPVASIRCPTIPLPLRRGGSWALPLQGLHAVRGPRRKRPDLVPPCPPRGAHHHDAAGFTSCYRLVGCSKNHVPLFQLASTVGVPLPPEVQLQGLLVVNPAGLSSASGSCFVWVRTFTA